MSKEQELLEAKEEYKKLKSLHKYAWNTYGSELCSAEMIRNEEKLLAKIEQLEKDVNGFYQG